MNPNTATPIVPEVTVTPAQRLPLAAHGGRALAAMLKLGESIQIDPQLRELVKLRASQLNGCAFCVDMHWREARKAGESEQRLCLLSAWREAPFYTARERAALGLTEAVTFVTQGHVPDAVWQEASAHFPPDELVQLLFMIAAINAWNRLAIATRAEVPRSAEAR
ncbi:carboxymuconolactone decarboxylase family protein [Aggregicoccus sp. 17bor-14]|uniref:carboxymuconolactone decarboxylase family protein n=1 Tax=Myxococcaceae TaxID=31 RepID=UPI00129C84E2|nr:MULTISPECIES: carboxymuconolactone decarboxylase family protein [Myxococcaceae]MBF5044055.1 carboxymuconolactone decarboxylase family protein [Simulacricoccus sp. 17bor-14]MRI89806.1 carboxymuconolactone decarboxylase family protein [Aggregicoccus sp. 17bor-14]